VSHWIEPLRDHDVSGFRSGQSELDSWLADHATNARGQGTRTYVLVDPQAIVVGYFAIAPHVLAREEAPRRIARGAPRGLPAILLGKLALAESHHGRGLGSELLVAALGTILDAARRAGGRLIVVDAIDDRARGFYEHHGFEPLPGEGRRLVMKLSTVAAALGESRP
jgi:GNAT superfamily N-acetyltransferase